MKISFITPSVSRSAGGIFEIELALAKTLHQLGHEVQVYGQEDENTSNDLPKWTPLKVSTYPSIGPHAFRYSPALKQAVAGSDAAIAHLHVIWMYTSVVTNHWAKTGKPYLVTPNGMLEPWALKNAGWKKKLVTWLYEGRCLRNAACIHANTRKEYEDIREFGLKNPVCIIPNGVFMPDLSSAPAKPAWQQKAGNRKVLLFLSRLHPKKGLENLLRAWAASSEKRKEWCLVIAGWGDKDYSQSLQDLARDLNLEQEVIFAGPQFDEEKQRSFYHAHAFILPSFSEGLPMAVLEAWSYGLPALITPACNIPEGYVTGAALKIQPEQKNITVGLESLFALSGQERHEMGQKGLAVVQQKFTWQKVTQQLASVYEWILNGGEQPACVVRD